jgi:serine protease AprX
MEGKMFNQIQQDKISSSMIPANQSANTTPILNNSPPIKEYETEIFDTFFFGSYHSEPIYYSPDDLTPSGKLPVLITSQNNEELNLIKDKISKTFNSDDITIKNEIPQAGMITAELDPESLMEFVQLLPDNSLVSVNKKLVFSDPDKVRNRIIEDSSSNKRVPFEIGKSSIMAFKLWELGYTGKGVGICFIDSGLYPHKDFENRIIKFVDMHESKVNMVDPLGHGTIVAGIAAGSGAASDGRFKGVAPGADIIACKVNCVDEVAKAIYWAIENKDNYHINILNISIGRFPLKSYKNDELCQAVEKAWDAGIVVVAAAGNEGKSGDGSINSPGIDPKIITVGYFDDNATLKTDDDMLTPNSSKGPTKPDKLMKPDLIAPGVEIYGPLSPGSDFDVSNHPHIGNEYFAHDGSSMSTPMVTGIIALLLEANPKLTPDQLKDALKKGANNYIPNATPKELGAGVVNAMKTYEIICSNYGVQDKTNEKIS